MKQQNKEGFWDNFNKPHLEEVLKAKKSYKIYQYFVDVTTGELKMKPEAFKNTNILLSCKLKATTALHHRYGVYLH